MIGALTPYRMDTMKAAMLKAFGSPLVIEELPDPVVTYWWISRPSGSS